MTKMQLFGLFICTQSPLYVSVDVFAHHQEHVTVFTASDIVHLCCCRLVSWMRWNSVIVNDDQQDATILVYLFIPSQLYMFRAMFLPIIRST